MPAVSVLPLGSTTVTSTYSDIASPKLQTSPQGLERSPSSSSSSTKEQGSVICTMDAPEVGNEAPKSDVKDDDDDSPPGKGSGGAAQDQDKAAKDGTLGIKDGSLTTGAVSPSQSTVSTYPQAVPTPQQHGYYVYSSQFNPEPPSPHGGGPTVYDVGSFFQQPTAAGFHNSPFGTVHPYGTQQQPPNSPASQSVGIPPASPLFPRMTGGPTAALLSASIQRDSGGNPALSPGRTYMTPHFGPSGIYMTPGGVNGNGNNSNEDFSGWGDNRTISYPPSPQISAQGIHIPYVPGMPPRSIASDRSGSFDDSMLPPSADSQMQHYGVGSPGQINGAAPGTLFAHQQPWGYGTPPPDMYGGSSPLQPRPTMPYPGQLGGPPYRHHPHHPSHPSQMATYGGQYYPATSPGPPIQTTASNKGPDGANLFIFHIPNHFSNLDMYNLFIPYGQLLSVRIMVEKDTGRSRGFGFVSYDSPDAAALAIKELNGFTVGNKRLKVQHKQIRPSDLLHETNLDPSDFDSTDHGGQHGQPGIIDSYGRGGINLPPSGPMAMSAGWYTRSAPGVPPRVPSDPHGIAVDNPAAPTDVLPTVGTINPAGLDGQLGNDALSSMEPLRQALPDVGVAATPALVGE